MNEIVKSDEKNLISLFHSTNGTLDMPKPFERDIFLFETFVAGTSYIEGIMELEPFLNIGDKLDFFREPDNKYDDKAIVIKTSDGVKIGYVPRVDNAVFSRLMDAGKLLFGKITAKKNVKTWLEIQINIYLHE